MDEIIPDSIRLKTLKLCERLKVDAKDVFELASWSYLEGLGVKKKRAGTPDLAYECFAAMFESRRTLPYSNTTADFVQLTKLRKRLSLAGKDTPDGWDRMCRNYFDSDLMVRYTLADLCARADIFMRQSLRRGNGQVSGQPNTPNSGRSDTTTRGERLFSRRGNT